MLVIWLLAIALLLGIHYSLKKKPQINKAEIRKIEAKLKNLTNEQKIGLSFKKFLNANQKIDPGKVQRGEIPKGERYACSW